MARVVEGEVAEEEIEAIEIVEVENKGFEEEEEEEADDPG
jgi:hypothetical protein